MRTQTICLAFFIGIPFCTATSQWVRTNGPDSGSISSLAVSGTNLFAGTWGGGVFRSTNSGTSWTVLNAGLTDNNVVSLFVSGTNLFSGTWSGGVFKSTDNGTGWTSAGLLGAAVQDFAISGADLFAVTGGWPGSGGVFLSTNNGTDWAPANNGLPANIRFSAIALSGTILLAATIEGGVGVFLSTNNGTSWTPTRGGLTDTSVSALTGFGTYVFAGTYGGGVFLSTNNGITWTSASGGLPNDLGYFVPVYCFAWSRQNLFAGTYGGVFLSTDRGTSWIAVNAGLKDSSVQGLAILGTNLFAAGTAGSVWRRPLSEMIPTSVNTSSEALPSTFSLGQNYPNPFNPSTTIKYELRKSSIVRLIVYDILGHEVSVLVNEKKNAATHEVRFDAAALPSGMYFYRLTAGQQTECRKMVLMK